MLADVLAAATPVGAVLVVAPGSPSLPAGVRHVPDPRRGQGAAVAGGARRSRCAAGAVPRRQRRRAVRHHARPARARGRRARRRARTRRRRRRDDQRARARGRVALPAGLRTGSAERFAALGAVATVRRAEPRRRRGHDGRPRAAPRAGRRAHRGACSRRCTSNAPREGRGSLGRRRRGALPARSPRGRRSGRGDDRRQRRRRPRAARAARLARPRQHPLHAHRPLRRRARLGAGRRELARARDGRRARRRRRGSGSATATSACTSCGPSCSAPASRSREATARLAGRLGSRGAAAAGVRRSGAHVPRDAGRDVPVPDLVRRARPPRRGRRRALRRRARGARRRPACSRRSRRPT